MIWILMCLILNNKIEEFKNKLHNLKNIKGF